MEMSNTRGVLRFGDFELDVAGYDLRGGGRPIRLERQPMDLLIMLVERRGELVSREDIVERLWGKDVFVDVDTGVHTAVRKTRRALRDSSEEPAFIETISGNGYRFIAAVEVVAPAPRSGPAEPPRGDDSVDRAPVGRVTIAVLPFENLAADPDRAYLAVLPVDPKWDAYRSDPRFDALLLRCGFAGTVSTSPSAK
jgi:DNA-binding winged helix-turn-helix (wHTH) protein